MLGQTATTDAVTGGLGSGKEHRQVQEDIETSDAKDRAAVLNQQLVRPWIDLEFGPQKLYPRIVIARPDEEDLALLAESLAKLVPVGLRIQASEVRDRFGFAEPEAGAEMLTPPPAPSPFGDPSRLAPLAPQDEGARRLALQAAQLRRAADAADLLASQAEDLAQPSADALIAKVRELVESAGSMQELRDRLVKFAPELPAADLANALGQAMAMAELLGRSEIAGQRLDGESLAGLI